MIAIGSDHGGYVLKECIKNHFKDVDFKDFGAYSEERTDYPLIAINVAESVASGECESGIVICKTGIGVCIAANKVKGIRCALCYNEEVAKLAKEHNNANMIALGAGQLTEEEAINIITNWRNSIFLGDRHENRINTISKYEK